MRLKHHICCLLLFITTFAMGHTNTNAPLPAFKKGAQWEDTTVRLIVADAPKADGKAFQEVKAKWVTYELTPEIKSKLTPRAPYTTVPDKLEIVTFHDPHTKKVIFIKKHQFYVSRPEGVTGFRPFFWQLWHYNSFMELAGLSGESADIDFFEKTFDVQKAVSAMIGPYEERVIHFKHALPDGYFNNDHQLFPSELKNAEMTKGVLRIDLWNPHKKIPASVWFNLDSRKVIRAKVEGEEKDIGDEKAFYAVPKEPNPKEHPWSGVYYHRNDTSSALPDVAVNNPVTLTLLPNDGLTRRGDGEVGTSDPKKPEQVEIRSTRLVTAQWLDRKYYGVGYGMEMTYVPVAWGERKYLVATNEMTEFCVAVNAGGEPRKKRFGKFLLHEGHERMKVTGWPEVPLKYRPYLLKEPIEATITKVGNIPGPIPQLGPVKIVLDKGRQAGVLEGMEFDLLPQTGYVKFKVKTVSDNSAEAVAEFYGGNGIRLHSGQKVSTRFQPRPVPISGEAEAQWELFDESEAEFKSPFVPTPLFKSR